VPELDTFVALVARLTRAGDPRLVHVGDTASGRAHLEVVAARTTTSVWNMQREYGVSMERAARTLNAGTRAAGLEERDVVSLRGAQHHPLTTTFCPTLRIHPVPLLLLVADRREVVVSGPEAMPDGSLPSWASDDPGVVAHAVRAFEEIWSAARPWSEVGLRPPLPPRRREVALGLLSGRSDREIAQELGTSERTVSAEVRAVVDWLGARNRTHAVAMLVGAG